MSAEDLQALRRRWRGMADRRASDEDRRYQVLVGAVLSSRAQSSVVAEGLQRLRAREGGLTIHSMASIGQEDLACILRSVHWNKAKAKYIRDGAGIILRRHGGRVPRARADIMALPGVGPALGNILVAVYSSWDDDEAADDVMRSEVNHVGWIRGVGHEKMVGKIQEDSCGVGEAVESVARKRVPSEAEVLDCCSDEGLDGDSGEKC